MRVATCALVVLGVGCGEVVGDQTPDAAVAPQVSISPAAPKTADDLVATAEPAGATLRWSKNGAVQAVSGSQVTAALTAKGEMWGVDVMSAGGEVLAHDDVMIGNTAPGMFDVEVQLAAAGTPVPCAVVTPPTDDDGDAITYTVGWQRNGAAYAGAIMTTFAGDTVPMTDHVAGDQFECTVTATDGSDIVTATAGARRLVPSAAGANGTVQMFVAPSASSYVIEAAGGHGGDLGGVPGSVNGAVMIGTFAIPAGSMLKVLVGQAAGPSPLGGQNLAGGGGTFVLDAADAPLVIAGGGGSHFAATPPIIETQGRIETSGGTMGATPRADNGMGGNITAGSTSGAGGGLLTTGAGIQGGRGFAQGATGGITPVAEGNYIGGFGGGGARGGSFGQGAGGGYSGGSCGDTASSWVGCGGGGSINMGTDQVNTAGGNAGTGYVKITW